MSEFSPVLLSVIQNGLSHIVDEMDLATERSAFNPAMSESGATAPAASTASTAGR